MKPLSSIRSPFAAFALGFFCGGIGLMIYLRTLEDFIIIALAMLLISLGLMPVGGPIWAALIVGVYGFFRVQASNAKLQGG